MLLINRVILMNKKYICMALLCTAVFPMVSMNRYAFSRENRVIMSVHMRSYAMHEEGIVPNHDLITLDPLQPLDGCLQCAPERIERNFFYGLGYIAAFAQYGPSVYGALCL